MSARNSDSFWEQDIYSKGQHLNRYPFDIVVSFVYRWHPRTKPRSEVRILEVGSGAGNNLWFAAREGFQVAGIDGSASAIEFTKARFAEDGLQGDFRVGNFLELPWPDDSFDLAIDRASLTCGSPCDQRHAIAEVNRVLRPGGLFLYNGYSDHHSSARAGTLLSDGRVADIKSGSLAGIEGIGFASRSDVDSFFSKGWTVVKREHLLLEDLSSDGTGSHTEWRVVARKEASEA